MVRPTPCLGDPMERNWAGALDGPLVLESGCASGAEARPTCFLSSPESQTQMSTAVPAPSGQAAPFKRPHSTISESSTSSSSSQPSTRGPWCLHGPGCPAHARPLSSAHRHWPCDIPTCIEEDEQEQGAGSQPSTCEYICTWEPCTLSFPQLVWVGVPTNSFIDFLCYVLPKVFKQFRISLL